MLVFKNHNVFTRLQISTTFDSWQITIELLIERIVYKIQKSHVKRLKIILSSIIDEVVKLFPELISLLKSYEIKSGGWAIEEIGNL